MNDITKITNEQIVELFGDTVDPNLIQEILTKPAVIIDECEVDYDQFSQWFSYALEGLIEAEEQSPEWWTAYRANEAWGRDIAEALNAWSFTVDDEDDV